MRQCYGCEELLREESFYYDCNYCKPCLKVKRKAYFEGLGPEKVKELQRRNTARRRRKLKALRVGVK